MNPHAPLLAAVMALAMALPLIGLWRRALLRWQVLDRPGARSSHAVPTPTGGGVAVTMVVVATWLPLAGLEDTAAVCIGGLMVALCLLSWLDDMRPLPAAVRLSGHAAAVSVALVILWPGAAALSLPGPSWPWLAAAGVGWVWFINLYNFMDGIDGITGMETLSIAAGTCLIVMVGDTPDHVLLPAATVAAAAAAFVFWNWHPAKLFLGDSGSVPIGFLLAWLLLELAFAGAWAAALILPLYYFADATITLGGRALRGQAVWHAHRQHFYQQAVQRGLSHSQVVLRITACNAVLMAVALLSLSHPLPALAGAAVVVALLLSHLRGRRTSSSR